MMYYRPKIVIVVGILFLAGCAVETVDEGPSPDAGQQAPTAAAAAPKKAISPKKEKRGLARLLAAEEPAADSAPEKQPEAPRSIPRSRRRDVELNPPGLVPEDSVVYSYLIQPDDYLTKVAFKEYGNPNEWRKIYRWNRADIGDDPRRIYPYRNLDLYKPEDQIDDFSYQFNIHNVTEGENLWTIAGESFGDSKAWVVIFWDNQDLLTSNAGMIRPGMELKVRSRLW